MTLRDHPQRFFYPMTPGALLKRAELAGITMTPPPKRKEQRYERNPAYLEQVRQCPCLSCGLDPCGEAAHVRMQSGAYDKHGGLGRKPADKWALPVCGSCHREDRNALHRVGEAIFWDDLGINPLKVCSELYPAKGDIVRMRAIVTMAIATRSKA